MSRTRRRKIVGVIPRLGVVIGRGASALLAHPQPLIVMVATLACAVGLWQAAIRSEAFRVTAVALPPESVLKVPPDVIGQNLWTVNVRALAQALHEQQPALKRVRVIRVLPNTVQVDITERTPVAQLRVGRATSTGEWHMVDGEGYVFAQSSPTLQERLVVFEGVESPREGRTSLKPGAMNTHPRLLTALRVAERLRGASALIGHRLSAIDVGDPNQLTFLIDEDVEIRCGGEDELEPQLERLRSALRLVSRQQVGVRYIDVRFTDPVIGPRT